MDQDLTVYLVFAGGNAGAPIKGGERGVSYDSPLNF